MLFGDQDRLQLEPSTYVKCFYELFNNPADSQRSKNEWKKCKKTRTNKKKEKKKVDLNVDLNNTGPPEIELSSNASAFAVFASVRDAILEKNSRVSNEPSRSSNCNSPQPLELSDSLDSDSDDEDKVSSTQNLPKIVGIGLRSVFTLMRESRTIEPTLCSKALSALLDVLQGQLPEGLKSEPEDVIEPLFDLLLDLATSHGPESTDANDGKHLTAIACACLLSLVVVRGDTGRLLTAIAALLMCPRALATQNIQMPCVLTSLQRSVEAVLLGKITRPDWISYGVPKTSKIYTFTLRLPSDVSNVVLNGRSFVSDGKYIYIHTNRGLLKIGSGYGGTIGGQLYLHKADFYPSEIGWLGYANNSLYFKCTPRKQCELIELDAETLSVKGIAVLEGKDWPSSVMFSDGDNLGMVTAGKDEGFVVRTINTLSNPVTVTSELPLKLARKCVDVFGWATFDEEQNVHTLSPGCDDEVVTVTAGKEFCILKTLSGKLLYSGKGSCLGMKNNTRPNRWLDFPFGKGAKILHLIAGHDGQHVVLVMEDGSVLFAGTARRGEDGDNSKVRRSIKPVKPKKMMRIDGQFIVEAACNNGSTALVTKEGSLLMFGKDTLHSDPATGLVNDLKGVAVQKVALGKAHAVIISNKGHLYTFGINNKGQCGRDFTVARPLNKDITVVAMETGAGEDELIVAEDEGGDQGEDWEETRGMCPPGQHQWRHKACMVCTVCRECTGFGISCLSSILPNRNPKRPGQECGCGVGDSGCAECGCCKTCARENCDNGGDMAVFGPSGGGDIGMMRLHMLFEGRSGSNLKDYLKRRLEERKQRQRTKPGPSTVQWSGIKMKPSNNTRPVVTSAIARKGVSGKLPTNNLPVEDGVVGSDAERGDATRIASIPPARVPIPSDSPVIQVSCGLHHTIILLQNGEVYSFGSNIYGQLGVGDLVAHAGPVHVKIPVTATQVAAGSNHSVILTSKGEVYTFGAYQKGQIGMNWWNGQNEANNSSVRRSDRCQPWHSFPNVVPNIGPKWGRRATWIGAASDQTFIKIDEINSINLTKSTVMANKNCIILIPHQHEHANTFKCLVINKRDGSCNSFSGNDQVDFSQCAVCLDSLYNVIWTFNPSTNEISPHNIITTEARTVSNLSASILSPGLALPIVPSVFVTRTQAAMHLLSCLDTLTQAQDERLTVIEENDTNQLNQDKIYSREDFVSVNRFENHGGGWGYSGHSVEAIRFMADTDILLGGYGLFGGRGEYTAKIKLYDIGNDGGDQENDGELLGETEEIPYECEPRQKYSILFEEPISLTANKWYVAWVRVSGPSSDCGSGGQAMVIADDQVVFYFKSSKKSNNGTDVNAGQIPQILYRITTNDNQTANCLREQSEPVYILKKEFSKMVTKNCFQSLISLLQWSWNTLKAGLSDITHRLPSTSYHSVLEMDHLVYISEASLRLLRTYINEVYPNLAGKKTPQESVRLAESIGEVRALLRQILSDPMPVSNVKSKGKTTKGKDKLDKTSTSSSSNSNSNSNKIIGLILDECHKTFVACYHAFYPTAYLKWTCLCELLSEIDKEQGTSSKDRLLSAVIASLCNSTIRLRCTFPILSNVMDSSDGIKRQLSPSDNSGLPMMNSTESHQYPILVEQMSYKSQIESTGKQVLNWSFREVLDRLLDLILIPVKKSLCREKNNALANLILHCCYLLSRVIAEFASQSSGNEDELQAACGRFMYTTPSRFTRTNQTRTWNTGNGSPDAICFSVDRPGIVVAGVGIYGGIGMYNYELELLDDQNNDPSHAQRWSSLDFTRGSFGPDDCINDIVELKFSKPLTIKENIKYAIRLRNHGGRTSNGDGGLNTVRGPDGTNFTFSACSLSFNGTTQTRGQIPHILYYSNPQDTDCPHTSKAVAEMQARKCTLSMTTTIVHRSNEILALARERAEDVVITEILGNATFVTTLLPLVMAHLGPLATSDPRCAVQVLTLIQEMLPHISGLNLLSVMEMSQLSSLDSESQNGHFSPPITTSHHYTWLESDHPYKPATISYYKVTFPDSVKWMTVEFTPECGTSQPEDYLQLYIPNIGINEGSGKTSVSVSSVNSGIGVGGGVSVSNNTSEDNNLMYIPVLHKMSNIPSQWPQYAIVLPGNQVIFSLETASDYMKDDMSVTYGFKCLIIGYDWISSGNGLKNLETELSFLGGACAASLMKKNLILPAVSMEEVEENVKLAQETAKKIFAVHSSLLGRGFALASPPTVTQALDGVLPFSCHSNERLFLRDFVVCTAGTSGGRLARWLQPESFVDPSKCEAVYSREDMKSGWPATVTVLTRDQYGDVVYVPGLKVEVKAVPIEKKDVSDVDQGRKIRRISQPDPMTFGGHPLPALDIPYEVTVNNKMCFYAITIMKAYQNYSFEELRLTSPTIKRTSESMMVRTNNDGSYNATWTPSSVGWYSFHICIDGYNLENNYKVDVKEPPHGMHPPSQSTVKKTQNQPSKIRKFVTKNSSGLRIRAHPSLQSEQIGIVPINGTITFIEEIHNDDGVWLRLNSETIKRFCSNSQTEAWCLGYNQHLGKTFLISMEEPKSVLEQAIKDTISRKRSDQCEEKNKNSIGMADWGWTAVNGEKTMVVTKAGASGHNIRNRPSLKAAPVGMLALGDIVTIEEYWVNDDGTWVRIDEESASKYCFNDGEAWSLAIDKHGTTHMKVNQDIENQPPEKRIAESVESPGNKGFDFSIPSGSNDGFNFSTPNFGPNMIGGSGENSNGANPFIFKSSQSQSSPGSDKLTPGRSDVSPKFSKPQLKERVVKEREREGGSGIGGNSGGGGKFSVLQKWLRGDDKGEKKSSSGRDFSELVGVSVKELVKAMGESRANGNGATPPDTPRKMSRSSSPKNPQGGSPRLHSRSSSPVPIPAGSSRQPAGNCLFPPVVNAPGGGDSDNSSSPRDVHLSPLVSGGMVDSTTWHRRGSTQSDTSALVSSLTRDPSQSPSGVSSAANTRDISPSPSCSSLHMRSEGSIASPSESSKRETSQDNPKKVSQAQTQTSPESATTAMRGHFSIGTSGIKDERQSPKVIRREHTKVVKTRAKRGISPTNTQQPPPSPLRSLNLNKEKVKEAISPSVAECLRAVFAAFLWHEGIVHDAMACASFLKFYPNLPKNGAVVVTRQAVIHSNDKHKEELTKEQRARQRHSVEVTNAGNYLHIQPSTLEALTRSAAGANANRNRKKQDSSSTSTGIIKEEQIGGKLSSLPETHTVTILPPALKSLVFLWEEVSTNCLQAIEQQSIITSPLSQFNLMKIPTNTTTTSATAINRSSNNTLHDKNFNKDLNKNKDNNKDYRKNYRKKKDWNKIVGKFNLGDNNGDLETTCELCGQTFPHPITYHMKMMHPGCGFYSGGMGYNNVGNYCSGWAGNCGDGDFGGTCWYLICDPCRDNYLQIRKSKMGKKIIGSVTKRRGIGGSGGIGSGIGSGGGGGGGGGDARNFLSPIHSPNQNDTHIIMKNNAMFLLDLSSAAGVSIPKQQRRPSQTLSSVAENYSPPESSGPFPPTGPFQCLQALGVHHSHSHDERYYEETLRRQNGHINVYDDDNCNNTNGRPLSEYPISDSDSDGSKGRGGGSSFHRSVSMSTGGPWSRNTNDGRIVMLRKRNNSSSEMNNDAGSSLLCYPSAALQKLVPSMDQSAIVSLQDISNIERVDLLMRPVMLFLLQQHNLQHLQLAMRQALRRAACRVYAMQAFNWLLRTVTQPMGLHDLLWWFMAFLTPALPESIDTSDEDNRTDRKDDLDMSGVYEHPLSDLIIAGEAVNPLPNVFHTLLQTIADLMLLPPPGSPLQQAAVQCWAIKFTPADHMFLHRSKVFSNISKILSRSEEEEDVIISMHESHQSNYSQQITNSVEAFKDLTSNVEIKASSRQAMIGHLTDNSTETFWESGDEDRNKTKIINIICSAHTFPRIVYIHIDNCRDLTHKVSNVTFQSGINVDEMIKLRTVEIESRSAGWVNCSIINPRHNIIGLEFKGPDNSLRVRQIRILGEIEGESLKVGKQLSTVTIQQRNCEAETLKVFRLITSQVFGKLIQGEQKCQQLNLDHQHLQQQQQQQRQQQQQQQQQTQPETSEEQSEELEESHNLREHVVGILFSRSKLTHLQKQVCTHIVQAIRKETIRLREEWETLLTSPTYANSILSDSSSDLPKTSDTYCFEMLSMVLALSGSSVGRNYLSHQYGLIKDILSLLHTGSARVQRQVTSLLRRILPEIKPENFANVLGIDHLPPTDFSIVSAANNSQTIDLKEHSPGILDVFLSCIAKTLSVQVKIKGKENNGKALQTVTLATTINTKNLIGARWWLRGCMNKKLAEVIIQLLKDMAGGKISEAWAAVTKAAIAENILSLTRLDEKNREPTECLKTSTLWLVLSSLCVLDSDHVERLSSGQWNTVDGQPPPPRPTCSNHDDDETTAIIQCNTCGNLCADCDRVLHLHRRTRMHMRQVCKEEEEAIRVDLHEGCGRTKLFWILALADSRTLKALVEFRDGTPRKPVGTTGVCRFCGATGNSGLLAIGNVCADQDCQEHAKNACNKTHQCGHICGGVRNEKNCLPCLHRCQATNDLKQDADDMCMICFTEALACAPAIQLQCGHVFHLHCCRNVLMKRWVGPRITFGFTLCPICKVSIEHPTLMEYLTSIRELYADVKRKALMRLEYEGLHKAEAVTAPGGRYYQDPAAYAMDRYAYYVCYKCQKAYYGGEARCDAQLGGESFDPTELVCGGCSDVARAQMCPKHGADFLEYKCRYCCSTAVFFCFGTTHFCNPCHDDFQRVTNIPKNELPSCPAGPRAKQLEGDECPLHVKHPPTGEEFALGCGICRNAHTF